MGNPMHSVCRETEDRHDAYDLGPFEVGRFDENGTTYRSFLFKITFADPTETTARSDRQRAERCGDPYIERVREAFVSETNGSGTSHYSLRGCFVDGLRQLVTVDKAMCFHVLKALIRSHDEGFSEGRADGIRYVMRAASDKRLKARKVSGRGETRVSVMHAQIPRYAECEITFEHTVPEPPLEDTE